MLDHVFAQGNIGPLALRNRLTMTAMGTDLSEPGGVAGARLARYYAQRARGGVGLVMTGAAAVAYPYGQLVRGGLAISQERHVAGIAAIADAVHAEGVPLGVQLNHNGHKAVQDTLAGRPLWGPGTPADANPANEYHTMSPADIAQIVSLFADAAERVQRAGGDAIEVGAAHGYLLSSFLSPYTNNRADEYGGSVENRSRFLVEVIRAIRERVGAGLAVWCKIDSQEFLLDEGISIEDAKVTAQLAQNAGADAIAVSAYADPRIGGMHMLWSHTPTEPAHLMPNAAAIRSVLHVPVISAGHMDPALAEEHISAGHVDFVGLGRTLLADPNLPRKTIEGDRADVRPCVYSFVCISEISSGGHLSCSANPEMGREGELAIIQATHPRSVVVVGGGPAGMEASHRLAASGHHVILLERAAELGGSLRYAAMGHEPLRDMLEWLKRQVARMGVDVRLATPASVAEVAALEPDHVVVAVGARRDPTESHWAASSLVMTSDTALEWAMGTEHGGRVVVVDGTLEGLAVAHHRLAIGDEVTVIDEMDQFGLGWASIRRDVALKELRAGGATLLAGARSITVNETGVRYVNLRGQTRTVGADRILITRGRANVGMAADLGDAGLPVTTIGDAAEIGYLDGALLSAAKFTSVNFR
jgi:2,4-dienoyl-CoA reductase (NADPH2)